MKDEKAELDPRLRQALQALEKFPPGTPVEPEREGRPF